MPTDIEEILLLPPKMVFWNVSNKSSEVGKRQNEKQELSNFRKELRNNYLIRSQLLTHTFSNNIFVYSNDIFPKANVISMIFFPSSLDSGPYMI